MKKGIMIFGAAGVGKSTLGKMTADALKVPFIDIDDYIWRKDTKEPFQTLFTRQERIDRLKDAIADFDRFIMAGSMFSIRNHFHNDFALGVWVHASMPERIKRLEMREMVRYGERVLPGGDLYEKSQAFLRDAALYETGGGSMSMAEHAQWAAEMTCPVLRIDGTKPIAENVRIIQEKYLGIVNQKEKPALP